MTVALDALSSAANSTGNITISHAGHATDVKAVIILVAQAGEVVGDGVGTVTYGGVTCTEVSGSPVMRGAAEKGGAHAFFLGTGVPQGTQDAVINDSGNSENKKVGVITLTGAADCVVVDSDGTINSGSVSNPSVTLNLAARTSFCCLVGESGVDAVTGTTPLSGWTSRVEIDWGPQVGVMYTYDTVGSTDVTAGWTQAADDATMVALAVSEVRTLAASGGSYAQTGTVTSLEYGSALTIGSGAYTSTGTGATLKHDSRVSAAAGAYNQTGTAASLEYGRVLVVGLGAYTQTGTAANLEWGRKLTVESGAYTETGTAASLEYGYALDVSSGTYVETGSDATLIYGSLTAYTIVADSGSYVETGTAANLEYGYKLTAESGTYIEIGTTANLEYEQEIDPASGSYVVTGTAATLTYKRIFSVESGIYAETGIAANLEWGRTLAVESGTHIETGTDANLEYGYRLVAATDGYVETGIDATLTYGRGFVAASTAYLVTGSDVNLDYEISAQTLLNEAAVIATIEVRIKKIQNNRREISPITGIETIYDDDGTTPWMTAAVYEDAAGTIPYRGKGAERRERFV